METIVGIVIGLGGAVSLWLLVKLALKGLKAGQETRIYASVQKLRSVGELVVFKIITKEIVTTAEHWFGEVGRKYLNWLVSAKKMVMVFEFEIDFRYDLRSPEFVIEHRGEGSYRLKMPKCIYQTHIRSVKFYDEQKAQLLPWLLPDLLNRFLDSGGGEDTKNRLIEEARHAAAAMAKEFVQSMRSEVQTSARQTLETLAKGFGAQEAIVDFSESELVQMEVQPPKEEIGAAATGRD